MKLTKKQIDAIRSHTSKTYPEIVGTFPCIEEELGCYTPANANWGYHAGWTTDGDLVVTLFGEVLGK